MQTQIDIIRTILEKQGSISAASLSGTDISASMLSYMVNKGILRRVSHGVYVLQGHMLPNETYCEVSLKVPGGVICLLSALQYHEITTQMPGETWVAIRKGSHYPRNLKIPVRVIQLSGDNYSAGIQTATEDGIKINVYSPAKTVVDCFRFRNKIGSDIAVEALRDVIRQKKAPADEIWEYACKCRATKIIRPYMEAV